MKISRIFIPVLLCCSASIQCGYSQQSRTQKIENQIDFTGGLATRYPTNLISSNQTQDALNVFFDNGSLEKRGGHAKQNNTAIGGGDHDVIGLYEYRKSDGTEYCVSFSSQSGYYSTDDCATNTAFISTLTVNQDVNCVPFNDRLYCVNGADTPLYFDGSSYTLVTDMPACKYIRAYQNRLWCAGASTEKSYIYYSAVGDGDSWDTTFNFVAFNQEDGDIITGIGEPIYETLPAYKEFSSWIVRGNSANDYKGIMVSNAIGATSHRDIRNFLLNNTKNIQVFSSPGIRGGEPGIYSFNGIVIQYLSNNISDQFEGMDTFQTSNRFKSFDSAADWNSGSQVVIDTYTEIGLIQNETWEGVDTSSVNFASGTLVSVSTINPVYPNAVTLEGVTFSNLKYTEDPTWTPQPGTTWSAANGYLERTGSVSLGDNIRSSSTLAYGDWSFDMFRPGVTGCVGFDFIIGTGGGYRVTSRTDKILLWGNVGGAYNFICNIDSPQSGDSWMTFDISRASDGAFTLTTANGSCSGTDNNVTDSLYMWFYAYDVANNPTPCSAAGGGAIDNIYGPFHHSTGTLTSRIFDTEFSTSTTANPAIGGPFEVTYSTSAGDTVWFYTRSSTSPNNDNWGSWYATTDTLRVNATQQYWQYKAEYETDYSSQTPVVYDVTLNATSTGAWTSGEEYLDSGMTSWGLFQSVEITSGAASWSYEMRSSTTLGGTASESWSAVTNNSLITISTGAYIQVRATNSVGSSTDTAKIDVITINYNVGSEAKSACAEVYRNRYYWFGQAQDSTENNVGYVLDANGAWTKLTGINARSTALLNGEFYTGDSITTDGGFIRRQDVGYADSGEDIEAYWQSKDYLFNSDDYLKTVDNVFATFPDNNATLTASLYGDGSLVQSWDINLSTSQTFGVYGYAPTPESGAVRAKYFNVKFSNTSAEYWKLIGYRLYWSTMQSLQP